MPDRIALFIDVDNLWLAVNEAGLRFSLPALLNRVREEGVLARARAYADWTQPRLPYGEFQSSAFEQVQLSSRGMNRQKNTADMLLALDALETALSPRPPDTFVIVSGDRDFVPLAQKLRQYGARVIGIGVKLSVSPVLEQACDVFVFYDELVPDPEVGAGPAPRRTAAEREAAFGLLQRATIALQRQRTTPTLDDALRVMQQLDATFDPTRYGAAFRDLLPEAEAGGYVRRVGERPDGTIELAPGIRLLASEAAEPGVAGSVMDDYSFETAEDARQSYVNILLERKDGQDGTGNIPLVAWPQRDAMVRDLWRALHDAPAGLTLDEIRWHLREFAATQGWRLADRAILKVRDTLNIGKCFSDGGGRHWSVSPDLFSTLPVRSYLSPEMALARMHAMYVSKILINRPGTPLDEEAAALLLFDRVDPDTLIHARAAIAEGRASAAGYLGRSGGLPPRRDTVIFESRPDGGRPPPMPPPTAPVPVLTMPSPTAGGYSLAEQDADIALLGEALSRLAEPGQSVVGSRLREEMERLADERGVPLYFPQRNLKLLQVVDQAQRQGAVRFEKPKHGDFKVYLPG